MTFDIPVCDAARTVIRLRDCSTPQRIVFGARIAAVEVDEAFLRQTRALRRAERRVDDDRRRAHAVFERGLVDDRLEGRAGLALGLRGAIEIGPDHVEAALHREDAAGSNLLGKEAATDFRDRAERVAARARAA